MEEKKSMRQIVQDLLNENKPEEIRQLTMESGANLEHRLRCRRTETL